MSKKLMIGMMTGAALLGGAAVGITGVASANTTSGTSTPAATSTSAQYHGRRLGMMKKVSLMGRGVRGTVSAVNGNTITITDKNGKTYTIDATNAKLAKTVTITAGDVKVGDTLSAQGKVSGTTLMAAHILDGVLQTQ